MDDDTFIYSPVPEPPPRRVFGGLGRWPAALIAAGGLLIGGGIGGFVIASAATPSASPTPSPSHSGAAPATPGTPGHHCTHMGGSSPGNSTSNAAFYY